MTDAMQITVSKEIAKRIEDNNSTHWLTARELERISIPWVETVMGTDQKKASSGCPNMALVGRRVQSFP
jgi:hypothetical protein